jgi:hypothetical protein
MGNPFMTKVTLGEGTTLVLMGISSMKVKLGDEGGFLPRPPTLAVTHGCDGPPQMETRDTGK